MKKLFIIAVSGMLFTACSKESIVAEDVTPKEATIEYMGNPAADGLGWVFRMSDESIEIPRNLDRTFQRDDLRVNVAYKRSQEKFPCRCPEPKYMVDVISIEQVEHTAQK